MMGRIRLGTLPRTKKWDQVVHLISGGANVEHIAAASAEAAERGLERASNDEGLAQAVWLLTQLPQAARHSDFSERLWKLGLRVSSRPTLLEIAASLTQAIDAHLQATGKRSDFGELALHAASQTIASLAGQQLPSLFAPTASDVQRAIAKLGTSKNFSIVARDYFSRLTSHSLNYFLSRTLSTHVGPSRRFASIGDHSEFKSGSEPALLGGVPHHPGVRRRMVWEDASEGNAHHTGRCAKIRSRRFQKNSCGIAQAEGRSCLSVSSCVAERGEPEGGTHCSLRCMDDHRISR
jgi:hypothetical protein